MGETDWILCPFCGSKTRTKIRKDTVLINFPLFCPKCKQESLIEPESVSLTSRIQRILKIHQNRVLLTGKPNRYQNQMEIIINLYSWAIQILYVRIWEIRV